MSIGLKNRPLVITALALQLCSVWRGHPILLIKSVEYMYILLLCKEPVCDDHAAPNCSAEDLLGTCYSDVNILLMLLLCIYYISIIIYYSDNNIRLT